MTSEFHPLVTFRDPEPKLFITQDALHRELGPLEEDNYDQQNYFLRAGDTTLIRASWVTSEWAEDQPLWCIWEAYGETPGVLFDGGLCISLEEAEREVRMLETVESPYPARYWHQEVAIYF